MNINISEKEKLRLYSTIFVFSSEIVSYDVINHLIDDLTPQMLVYKITSTLTTENILALAKSLSDPISQRFFVIITDNNLNNYQYGSEIPSDCHIIRRSLLTGMTNNLAKTVQSIIEDMFYFHIPHHDISTAEVYFSNKTPQYLGSIYNPLIQQIQVFDSLDLYKKMECSLSYYPIELKDDCRPSTEDPGHIELLIDDKSLTDISNKYMLNMTLLQMHAIRNYFCNLRRNPTRIELEMLAQSWSEHCKHNIFCAEIDEIKEGIYKHYIKKPTEEIIKTKNLCVSVFSDNAGAIVFDEKYAVAAKVETHNSPSALEPRGGAMTGLLGVNRDIIGFGLGALPISNHYVFCFNSGNDTYYRDSDLKNSILKNQLIERGVTNGVMIAGNHSGIPTTNGIVHYGVGFSAKPLVFVGTVGIIPIDKCFKETKDGDLIVIVGGRTGRDGIHGATFSSTNLSNVSSTVVQIGDAITQKKFSDALIKEARDLCLYNAITDNGAGGLSSSVGEMGKDGFIVDLCKVKLKSKHMESWEIWISESQERMTLSVPKEKYPDLERIMKKNDVETYVIGEFNKSGRAIIKFNDTIILNLDTKFIHEGNPKLKLKSEEISYINGKNHPEIILNEESDLYQVINHKNIRSRRKFAHTYDHEVQGITILKPLQGEGKVFSDTTILKPLFYSKTGIVQSQSLGIFYEHLSIDKKDFHPIIHPYFCAKQTIETAIRNIITAGANLEKIALLDNFCWSNFGNDVPYNSKRLWQLKNAAKACHDLALFFGTPFISGKDSMFNNTTLYDSKGNLENKSNFPVLLVTSIGIIDDINLNVSLDAKIPGDLIYVIGNPNYQISHDENDLRDILTLYKNYSNAVNDEIISSAIPINFGGILVALAKTLIGGLIGAEIDFKKYFNQKYIRFPGIVATIDPKNEKKFVKCFNCVPIFKLGHLKEQSEKDSRAILNISGIGDYSVYGEHSLKSMYEDE